MMLWQRLGKSFDESFFDIHMHILPGVDDGPRTLNESLEMVKTAVACNTKSLVATPHVGLDFGATKEDIYSSYELLKREIKKRRIPIDVHLGAEIPIGPDLDQIIDSELLTIAGSKCILTELPIKGMPIYVNEVLFKLVTKGITPIIAHPERNSAVQASPQGLESFVKSGCLVQINAGSLTGIYGNTCKRTAIELLKRDLVHAIASDAHNVGRRSPDLRKAISIAAKFVGKEKALKLGEPLFILQQ